MTCRSGESRDPLGRGASGTRRRHGWRAWNETGWSESDVISPRGRNIRRSVIRPRVRRSGTRTGTSTIVRLDMPFPDDATPTRVTPLDRIGSWPGRRGAAYVLVLVLSHRRNLPRLDARFLVRVRRLAESELAPSWRRLIRWIPRSSRLCSYSYLYSYLYTG